MFPSEIHAVFFQMRFVMSTKERIWRKATDEYLKTHPWCLDCAKRNYTGVAEFVVHFESPKGNQLLFWDMNNWKAVCESCHKRQGGSLRLKIPNPIIKKVQLYTVG